MKETLANFVFKMTGRGTGLTFKIELKFNVHMLTFQCAYEKKIY